MAEMLAPPRPKPMQRLAHQLFGDRYSAILSVLLLALLIWISWRVVDWGILHAEISPDPAKCRASGGACWGVLVAKARLVLLGRFPLSDQWRAVVGTVAMIASLGLAALPGLFGKRGVILICVALLGFCVLLNGDAFGLKAVGSELWSGLPLTILLGVLACLFGLPIGIALALARRSKLPVLRWLASGYIELVRGLPLITLLFFGAFVLPILLPANWQLDPMLRIAICVVGFAAAYLAEVVRGGLQAISRGHLEAARALHLTWWQTLAHVVLPLALRITLPSMVSLFIGTVKDTSLVSIVNIYDLTGMLRLTQGDAVWRPYFVEMYLMVSAIYLAFGLSLAAYGRYLEHRYALK